MSLIDTPLSEQIHIVLFGLRNVGKSSLMNSLFNNEIAIVSNKPGTTTDPVTRTMELGKLGPVAFTDTAGFDDEGDLGMERIKKSVSRINTSDIPILVTRADHDITQEEESFVQELIANNKPVVVAVTHSDLGYTASKLTWCEKFRHVSIDNTTKIGMNDLKNAIIALSNEISCEISPVDGLINENDLIVLVTPIDSAAPKGRLILPQVETIRAILDKQCATLVVKENELKYFYDKLLIKPKLVITDSQAFNSVASDIPVDQPLTSFSILFARKKGDFAYFVESIKHIENTPKNAKILVLESCSHHKQPDDIGTVKIPRLFKQKVEPTVNFEFSKTLPAPAQLKDYYMVINCAGCMVTRNVMMQRINVLKENNIHAINYGLFFAWANGLLPRALEPFPVEYDIYNKSNQ